MKKKTRQRVFTFATGEITNFGLTVVFFSSSLFHIITPLTMPNKYPSEFIEKYPRKLAFLIDCCIGLRGFALNSQTIDSFPSNSDIFLFYPNNEPGMIRRLKRIELKHNGVFMFPTSEYGSAHNLSFVLGQIQSNYNDFIIVANYHSAYVDLCEQMIQNHEQLRNHIQIRSFGRFNEFEKFIKEMARLQNEDETKKLKENHKATLNFSRKHLFHACPFESRQDSSYLYRFGELLQHLDAEHSSLHYEYCAECQQFLADRTSQENAEAFEQHVNDKHLKTNDYRLVIRSKEAKN